MKKRLLPTVILFIIVFMFSKTIVQKKSPVLKDKNSHLCFSVASVTEFIKVLDKNKIEYENWAGEKQAVTNRVDGVKQIYLKDPDGYWLEINDARE